MTPELLDRVVAAYGSGEALAAALGINSSTLRRWRSRTNPIPDWFWKEVPPLLLGRVPYLRAQAIELRVQADACETLAAELDDAGIHATAKPPSR